MTRFFDRDERQSFSFADLSAFFTPSVRMMGTPNSLSSEGAKTFESLLSGWSTSYSGILPLRLSDFGLGGDVLSSREGSCGQVSLVELVLSFRRGLGQILTFNSSSIVLDGVESGLYQDVDSSKKMA